MKSWNLINGKLSFHFNKYSKKENQSYIWFWVLLIGSNNQLEYYNFFDRFQQGSKVLLFRANSRLIIRNWLLDPMSKTPSLYTQYCAFPLLFYMYISIFYVNWVQKFFSIRFDTVISKAAIFFIKSGSTISAIPNNTVI